MTTLTNSEGKVLNYTNEFLETILQKVCKGKTKHIEIPYFYAREMVIDKKRFNPQHVDTEENTADILTKALTKGPFQKHRNSLVKISSELQD